MRKKGERGLTLVELIVAFTILSLLTTMAVPLARYKVASRRRRSCATPCARFAKAIDDYKDASIQGKIETKLGTDGYPETLEQLVNGVKLLQSADGKMIKFLRRIPKDPMTNSYDWGKRSTQDDPRSTSWGGQNIFECIPRARSVHAMERCIRSGKKSRLHAGRADDRHGDHLHPGVDRRAAVSEGADPHEGKRAQEQPVHHAQRDRRIHLRQEESSPGLAGPGDRRLSARGSRRSHDRQQSDLAHGHGRRLDRRRTRPSRVSGTCAADRTRRAWKARPTPTAPCGKARRARAQVLIRSRVCENARPA